MPLQLSDVLLKRQQANRAWGQPVVPGNINLMRRPVALRSMSFGLGDRQVLLPTIDDTGQQLTPQQALELFRRTGQHLGQFRTVEEATDFAKRLSTEQGRRYQR